MLRKIINFIRHYNTYRDVDIIIFVMCLLTLILSIFNTVAIIMHW